MHPDMASALANQHRHDMTGKAGQHAQAALAAQAAGTAEPGRTAPAGRRQAAASPRGPRRGARRPHLPGPLPRYRVSWSRTALSTAAADGAGRGRSWVIVISATRGL